jgi:UDP-3-O-acyl-N-acetylglucosamine deacetylase
MERGCQYTLKKIIEVEGIDFTCGNLSTIYVEPAPPNTGIVFETPKGERIKATLENAVPSDHLFAETLILRGQKENIAAPEHSLAAFQGYGVDNAIVKIEKKPSITSSLFKHLSSEGGENTYFVPHVARKLCDALDNNVEEQDAPRKIFTLKEQIENNTQMKCGETKIVEFRPYTEKGLTIKVEIAYPPDGRLIRQEVTANICPETTKDISAARGYCRTLGRPPKWFTK